MKKIREILIILALFTLTIILNVTISEAASSSLKLNNLDFAAQINEDGSMEITETWDIEIENTNTLFKTFKTDNTKYSGITDVTVSEITSGAENKFREINQVMYHVTQNCYYGMENSDRNFEIAWGVGLDDSSATKTYKITYTVEDAIAKYNDYAELYWQFIGEDFEIDAKKITGTIYLPSNANSKDEIKVWGHTQDLNGEIYATDTNKIEFELNDFRSGAYVEIRSLFPRDMITYSQRTYNSNRLDTVLSEETKWADEANRIRFKNNAITYLAIAGCLIIVAFIIRNIYKRIKEIKNCEAKFKPSQEIIYFRDIPRENATPAQALLIKKIGQNLGVNILSNELGNIVSATMLDLSLKGIISFRLINEGKKKDEIIIEMVNENAIPELESENEKIIAKYLLNAYNGKSEITLKDLQRYIGKSPTKVEELRKKIELSTQKELIKKRLVNAKKLAAYKKIKPSMSMVSLICTIIVIIPFFISITEALSSKVLIFGMIPITIATIVNNIVNSILAKRLNVLTQAGVDEQSQWEGLIKFMKEFSMLDKREIPEVVIWEKFLVYATVFGVAEIVLKQLKMIYPEIESQDYITTYAYIGIMTHTNFSNTFSRTISNSISSAASSGSGGGGGFSGGGGGGRRPEVEEEVDKMEDKIEKIHEILNNIEITEENRDLIEEIREDLYDKNYIDALDKMGKLKDIPKKASKKAQNKTSKKKVVKEEKVEEDGVYPKQLSNVELERKYIGLLLEDPKLIVKYYFLFDECYFEDESVLNIYKSVLFTEGGDYASERVKEKFNFARDSEEVYQLKNELMEAVRNKNYNMEKIYIELKKLFVLRKHYLAVPIKSIQNQIVDITNYKLYDKMSVEEVESAVVQVNDTEKFKRAILNKNLTTFLERGDNNLRNGLSMPFPILTSVFKGVRKGETMAYAMPSNAGKSRFTINIAAHTALVHKKKVLIISNEMSEDKMRLCLITTILNNEEIQKIHGYKLHKTEGELLEFKFRADDPKKTQVDKDGFVLRKEGESQQEFVERLTKESKEFNDTIAVTDWINQEINNSIYFINITDHTNDELKKVIMNYYYKEQIEYVYYDTLKTDTANIGIGEELKKTATILSNLAQNFNLYICSTLQLQESNTLPINLNVNDLAVSRTVKEVLDTLCLVKQISRDNLQDYEYSLKEVDTKFYDLKKYDDPDVRYYACVVDKNRAGAKPKLLFRLNLAYNVWEELGYLHLKQNRNK